ncbi:MAG: hypothetical protein JXA77_02715 [Bacteroidales bacterium]|nr:hypothetical protein [Bacteroidales bacterium]MBN2817853.1 hypothetical protein [Bacteroidales bacterium]
MKNLTCLFLIASIILFSCNDENEDDLNNDNTTTNVVEITDDVDVTTTWSGDSIYVIKAWDFYVTATLTIEPGCIIKFTAGGSFMGTSSGGTIVANGTAEDPIVFTSIKDDEHGGDVNGDGDATSPAPRDWAEILIQTNGSSFTNCMFLYGGNSTYLSTLNIYDVTANIVNCTFAYNYGGKSGDFYYGALDATSARFSTVIKNNVFYGNNIPLSIESTIDIDNSNSFINPSDQSETNTMNGIFVYSYDDFNRAVSWAETEVPFVINDNDLWIESSNSLSLANNVVLKFTPESAIVIGIGGTLNQNNTNKFTSFKDDSPLGDTNGDGDATSPADGDWEGIYDDDALEYVSWTNIYYDNH